MALAVDEHRFTASHPDDAGLMPFDSEAAAVEYVVRCLSPFCQKFTPELQIGNGLRPDLVAHFTGAEEVPIAIEVKQFSSTGCKPFPEAVRQAASYAKQLGHPAFIAPLAGRGAMRFQWNLSPIGSGLLVAGQFGVGGIYFAHDRYRDDPVGGLILAGVQVASLKIGTDGAPLIEWRFDAAHLLKLKQGHGSKSWR